MKSVFRKCGSREQEEIDGMKLKLKPKTEMRSTFK